jgi:hypothetical protein
MGSGARKAANSSSWTAAGVLAVQPLQRQRPGGVEPAVIAQHLAAGEQGRPVSAESAQIVARRQVGLLQIGGGLRGGQRQVAQLGGKLVGQLVVQIRNAGPQQRHRLRPGQHVHLQPPADRAPAREAGGDQHVPGPAGPVVGDVGRPLGVVEDEQPTVPVAQLGEQPVHGVGHRGPGRQLQPGCQPGQLVGDQHGLFGVDPPDHVVVGGEPMGVLERQLGLAHPAQPVEGLHHQRGLPGPQPSPQLGQKIVAAGEVRIAGRQVPYPAPARRAARRDGRPVFQIGRPRRREIGGQPCEVQLVERGGLGKVLEPVLTQAA